MRLLFAAVVACLLSFPGLAQQSTQFKIEESTFNAGGRPSNGNTASSTSFRVSLDSVGEALLGAGPQSTSFASDAGFVSAYRPPGEVVRLRFPDPGTLVWQGDASAVEYNLYRDTTDVLNGSYGVCEQSAISGTSAADLASPPLETVWFYLVTARNRLNEEGTLGFDAAGVERPNGGPCP